MQYALMTIAGWYIVISVFAFCAYGLDKRAARRGTWRWPEARLHKLALLGGFPGAFLGQRVFRHKTRKVKFLLVFWAVVLLHVAAWAGVAWLWWGRGA